MSFDSRPTTAPSFEDAVQTIGDPIEARRKAPGVTFPGNHEREPVFSHWADEQRAWEETCYIGDYSFTEELLVKGPDVLELFKDLTVNAVEEWEYGQTGRAKHANMCNQDGKVIFDGISFWLAEDTMVFQALPLAGNDWIRYHIETGDYDVTATIRETCMVGVQGPNALDVVDEMIEGSLENYGLMQYEPVEMNGRQLRAIGHGMAGEPGVEFHGPQSAADEIWETALEVGEEYGIRRLGGQAQFTARTVGGSIPVEGADYLPAVYGEDTREFREWLPAECSEAMLTIEGSFEGDDISDWFKSPVELGRENVVAFDHDYIGREALEAEMDEPERTLVNLVWDEEDVAEVQSSYTQEDNYKFIDIPGCVHRVRLVLDEVRKDGELVGTCSHPGYSFVDREFVSPGFIDVDYADPGTEVTIIWGEGEDGSDNPNVVPHQQTEVRAVVNPGQYKPDRRGKKVEAD